MRAGPGARRSRSAARRFSTRRRRRRSRRRLLTLGDFFDDAASAASPARAALVPAGATPPGRPRRLRAPGRRRSWLYGGRCPPARSALDERVPVPVVARADGAPRARCCARRRRARAPGVSIGAARAASSARGRPAVAPFSSRGLAFDGRVKPELVARGRGARDERARRERRTGRRASGRSTARAPPPRSQPARLRCSRRRAPSSARRALKSLLVGSARPLAETLACGAGRRALDVGAAAAAELAATPPRSRSVAPRDRTGTRRASSCVRNVSSRNAARRRADRAPRLSRRGRPCVTARRARARPASRRRWRASGSEVARADAARGGPPAEGAVVLGPSGGATARVPFAVAFAPRARPLLADVGLVATGRSGPRTPRPAVLSLVAGRVRHRRRRGRGPAARAARHRALDGRPEADRRDRAAAQPASRPVRVRDHRPRPGGQRLKAGLYRAPPRRLRRPAAARATAKSLPFRIE